MTEFDAREFYEISLKIAEAFQNEAGYRTAIGRAYYACHLIGIEATSMKGWYKPAYNRGDHFGLCNAIKNQGKILKQAESKLRALIELREHADYHVKNRSEQGCQYCREKSNAAPLVNEQTWDLARSIASDILPKLGKIKPQAAPH
jgi:hypothetical protein